MIRIIYLINVLRYGAEISNVEIWKQRTIVYGIATSLVASLVALLKSLNVDLPISPQILEDITTGIVAVGGVLVALITAATSKRAGIPGLSPANVDGVAEESPPVLTTDPTSNKRSNDG